MTDVVINSKEEPASSRSRPPPPSESLQTLNPDEPDARLRFRYGRGSVYEAVTCITGTLDLLSESNLVCHDERMFQVLHLQTELAWYNIHYELRSVIKSLEAGALAEALRLLLRVERLAQIPMVAMETMVACLSQVSLLAFRALLPDDATGIDSPGMINLRYISRPLWSTFEEAIGKVGQTPETLALKRARMEPLSGDLTLFANVFDAIQQLDIRLMSWKQLHLRLVWMHLGGAIASMQSSEVDAWADGGCPVRQGEAEDLGPGGVPKSLRGRPISELQKITVTPLFPKLWRISDLVFQEMTKSTNGAGTYGGGSGIEG